MSDESNLGAIYQSASDEVDIYLNDLRYVSKELINYATTQKAVRVLDCINTLIETLDDDDFCDIPF